MLSVKQAVSTSYNIAYQIKFNIPYTALEIVIIKITTTIVNHICMSQLCNYLKVFFLKNNNVIILFINNLQSLLLSYYHYYYYYLYFFLNFLRCVLHAWLVDILLNIYWLTLCIVFHLEIKLNPLYPVLLLTL